MKPEYRITFAIASILILTALIFPPWKNSYTEQFSGFHYLFSNAELVKMLELDYARLAIIILGIVLTASASHSLLYFVSVKSSINYLQYFVKKKKFNTEQQPNILTDNYLIIKLIILLILGIMVV